MHFLQNHPASGGCMRLPSTICPDIFAITIVAAALCKALASLNRSLRQRGSALAVRVGPWEEQLPALAAELGAGSILAEQEVEAGEHVLGRVC